MSNVIQVNLTPAEWKVCELIGEAAKQDVATVVYSLFRQKLNETATAMSSLLADLDKKPWEYGTEPPKYPPGARFRQAHGRDAQMADPGHDKDAVIRDVPREDSLYREHP
jgi:hypothetical protein